MRNWYNNLTPNLSISPLLIPSTTEILDKAKEPLNMHILSQMGMISVGNQFSRLVVSDAL